MPRSRGLPSDWSYALNRTYADFLTWHMDVWGTRASGHPDVRGEPWHHKDFLAHVFWVASSDQDIRDFQVSESDVRKLNSWRGSGDRPIKATSEKIETSLFGADFAECPFANWRADLRLAWVRSKGLGNNKCTIQPEATVKTTVSDNSKIPGISTPSVPDKIDLRSHKLVASYETFSAIELGIRRELLEILALRFGHDSADAPDLELLNFLKRKAEEYHKFRKLVSSQSDMIFFKEVIRPLDAIYNDLEASEIFLIKQEEKFINKYVIPEVAGVFFLTEYRGFNEMRRGNYKSAFNHFETCASYYAPFHKYMEAKARLVFAKELYDGVSNKSKTIYKLVSKMLRPAIEYLYNKPFFWAIANCYMALSVSNEANLTKNKNMKLKLLLSSISYFENAIFIKNIHINKRINYRVEEFYCKSLSIISDIFLEDGNIEGHYKMEKKKDDYNMKY